MQRPWHIFGTRGFLMFAAMLVSIELLLRAPVTERLLPPPRPYHSDEVEQKNRDMRALQRAGHPVDVLFIGSSITRTAIWPTVFDELTSAARPARSSSYNASLGGLGPIEMNLFLEHLYLRRARPHVVMEGLNFSTLIKPGRGLRGARADTVMDPLSRGIIEPAWRRASPQDQLLVYGMEHSRLLNYRGMLGSTLLSFEKPKLQLRKENLDARGFELRARSIADGDDRKPNAGPYAATESPFNAEMLDAIRRSAELCRKHGIDYILVRVPEHGRRFEGRDGLSRAYADRLHEFAKREHIRLIDVVGNHASSWNDDRLYTDMNHMSAAGARSFTTLLARSWLAEKTNR